MQRFGNGIVKEERGREKRGWEGGRKGAEGKGREMKRTREEGRAQKGKN